MINKKTDKMCKHMDYYDNMHNYEVTDMREFKKMLEGRVSYYRDNDPITNVINDPIEVDDPFRLCGKKRQAVNELEEMNAKKKC